MNAEFLRYSCQIALPGFTEDSQQMLKNAKVLIAGAGGLGCPAAQYLVSSGVGTIGIADHDTISIGNLHRQILFNENEVGQYKVDIACNKLKLQNPHIKIIPHKMMITSHNVIEVFEHYDLILDGTDNFETKYLLNDACVLSGKPLIHGAIYQYEGQVAVWNVKNSNGSYSPNFRDIFPEVDAASVPNCVEGGVIPTLAGIIGCMQANEAIKVILNSQELLSGKLLIFNAQNMTSRIINIGQETHVKIKNLIPSIEIPTIKTVDLQKNISSIHLIDIRTIDERRLFDIGGDHYPMAEIDVEHPDFDINKLTVFYCASGKRSSELVKKIKINHPDSKVFTLDGGLKAWKEAMVQV